MYQRRTKDVWCVQGHFTNAYGWETVYETDSKVDAYKIFSNYREEDPFYEYRIKKVRVKL